MSLQAFLDSHLARLQSQLASDIFEVNYLCHAWT